MNPNESKQIEPGRFRRSHKAAPISQQSHTCIYIYIPIIIYICICMCIYIYIYIYVCIYIYIYAWCILHQVFSHPPCQNKATCLPADQSWDSEGYFTWPAWWIEFIVCFTLAFLWRLRIWVVVHDPNRNFLSRNFFGRSLRGKGVEKPKRKTFCPGGVWIYCV